MLKASRISSPEAKMINCADVIVDLQQGDSGKGKVANYLAQHGDYTHVIRYNGSNNCGHTVYLGDKKVVTHSIPVGVLHGVKSIIGSGCVLNVEHFFNELREIEDAGISTGGLVYIAANAHIITDSHLEEDRTDTKIGTTKRGNGPAYRDKYARKGVRAADVAELRPYIVDLYNEFYNLNSDCKILFEGAQGFYLDIDWGDYPYVTSSHCTVGSAIMNGVPPQAIRKVLGVAKIYETYVGTKKFEPDEPVFQKIRELGGEYGATTGRPRQCNWLNLNNLMQAARINGVTHLVINKMDILRELGEWKMIVNDEVVSFPSEKAIKEAIYSAFRNDLNLSQILWSDNPHDIGHEDESQLQLWGI
jgi:adenylosuccinate synthase